MPKSHLFSNIATEYKEGGDDGCAGEVAEVGWQATRDGRWRSDRELSPRLGVSGDGMAVAGHGVYNAAAVVLRAGATLLRACRRVAVVGGIREGHAKSPRTCLVHRSLGGRYAAPCSPSVGRAPAFCLSQYRARRRRVLHCSRLCYITQRALVEVVATGKALTLSGSASATPFRCFSRAS